MSQNQPIDRLMDLVDKFEDQFSVRVEPTGHDILAENNDGIAEIEYWVHDLIHSPVEGLDISVGGWFSLDTRGEEDSAHCNLVMKVNGETIGDCQSIQSWYDNDSGRWSDPEWEVF